jgi:hypothetical protein
VRSGGSGWSIDVGGERGVGAEAGPAAGRTLSRAGSGSTRAGVNAATGPAAVRTPTDRAGDTGADPMGSDPGPAGTVRACVVWARMSRAGTS